MRSMRGQQVHCLGARDRPQRRPRGQCAACSRCFPQRWRGASWPEQWQKRGARTTAPAPTCTAGAVGDTMVKMKVGERGMPSKEVDGCAEQSVRLKPMNR